MSFLDFFKNPATNRKDLVRIYTCAKCFTSTTNEAALFKDYFSEKLICEKCLTISIPGKCTSINEDRVRNYIWSYSIDEKGIEWFKKARNKLIKKLDEEYKKRQEKERNEHLRIVKKIEAWK